MQDPDVKDESRRDTQEINREELQRLIRQTQSPPPDPGPLSNWVGNGDRMVIEDDGEIA